MGPPLRNPLVDVVIPVRNEQRSLRASVSELVRVLDVAPFRWRITIADNGSTDDTPGIADGLAAELSGVRVLHLDRPGRGRALRAAWLASEADVVAYTDVDLSTRLEALLPLVAPLVSGHSDVAIGSRLAAGARVERSLRRELISRAYNLVVRVLFGRVATDLQCGFKAVRADAARRLVPLVEDDGWFFDTELLLLAHRNRLRIHEVPVDWVEDPISTVDVVRTAVDDLRGLARMRRRFWSGGGRFRPAGADEPRPQARAAA